jgi:hypothetical protein
MEETYSPPILLNGFLSKSVDSFTPEEMNPAFKVKETKIHDFKFSLEYRIFPKISRNVTLGGFITKLTIHIPKSQDHPFWKQSPTASELQFTTSYATLSFQVERWGLSEKESYHHAVQRAKDIIACIRVGISDQRQLDCLLGVQCISPLAIPECPVLTLGYELNDLWIRNSQSSQSWSEKGRNILNALLRTKVDSVPRLQILLQYYQVNLQLYISSL